MGRAAVTTPSLRELRHLIHGIMEREQPPPALERQMFAYVGQLLDLPVELRSAEYDKLEQLSREQLLVLIMYLIGYTATPSAAA